jgi:hypothetical protein
LIFQGEADQFFQENTASMGWCAGALAVYRRIDRRFFFFRGKYLKKT